MNYINETCTYLFVNHVLGHFNICQVPVVPDPCHLDQGVEDYPRGLVNDAVQHSKEMTLPNEMT